MPIICSIPRFSGLPAVAYTSAPRQRASWIAAMPTPPVAWWISTRSPARNWARVISEYHAVVRPSGSDAASWALIRAGRWRAAAR